MGRYPYIDQAGDQSQKGGYQESCQTEIVRYKRNAEVFFFKNHCKEKNQAVARLTEPFRLEMKKAVQDRKILPSGSQRERVLSKWIIKAKF